MADTVKLSCGVNETTAQDAVGWTVDDVANDPAYIQVLGLNGDESASVSSNGGSFRNVDLQYVLQAGDELQFSRSGGQKG